MTNLENNNLEDNNLSNDKLINDNLYTRSSRRKLIKFFKKHKILKICIVAGLSFTAIITFYPPARKLVKKLLLLGLNVIKYKSCDEASLNNPNSSDLTDNPNKWGRVFTILIPLLGIVFTLLNRGKNGSQSIPVNVSTTSDTTEVPFSRAMRDNAIMWFLLALPSLFRGFFFGG